MANLERAFCAPQRRCPIVAFVYAPQDHAAGWSDTDLVDRLATLPGLSMVVDPGGAAAAGLGMSTSGHVVLYDRDGRLAFTGGVTPSRGEEGDCLALDALIDALAPGDKPAAAQSGAVSASVFGCPLCNDTNPPGCSPVAEGRR